MITIKTNRLTGGAICSALCVIMLVLASVIPNFKLAFLFASSLVMGICLLRYKLGGSVLCYVTASIIAIIVLPNKLLGLAFFVLFGNYPIIKLYIEKTKRLAVECIAKFIMANIYIFLVYVVLKALDSFSIFDFSLYLLYFSALALFVFYDVVFSLVINSFYKSYYKYLK